MVHLTTVIEKLAEVGLKLKPSKCHFAKRELEYLGHVVSRDGLKTSPRLVEAVQHFPALNHAPFTWSPDCQTAFEVLKRKLVTSPVLAYPNFKRDFVLETDASIHGIGAVLGQHQDDGNVHPISYASRALSVAEINYGITELETLAVVWAISHFHHFLYGHSVTVYTDHTAVKAVLESQNPTGKHARWWNKVYGGGVRAVHIVYRAGKENKNADALSRRPVFPAPQAGIAENELQVAPVRAMPPEELNSPPLPCSIQGCDDPALEPTWTSSSDPVTSIRTLYQTRDDNIGTHHCTPIDVSVCPIASHGDGAHTDMHVGQDFAIVDSTLEESSFASEQRKDSSVREIIDFIRHGTLPADNDRARKIALQQSMFTTTDDGILHFIDSKHKNNTSCCATAPPTTDVSRHSLKCIWRSFLRAAPLHCSYGPLVVGGNVQ